TTGGEAPAPDRRGHWYGGALAAVAGHCRRARRGVAPWSSTFASRRASLRNQPVPGARVHFQACPDARGGLRGLLRERQRLLHGRIVSAIEQHDADRLADQVERLPHHALRGEVWDKAVAYCRQAGDKAVARSASREAVACFEQALVALEHLPEDHARHEQAIDVRFGLRHALSQRREFGRVLTYLREAEGLAQALGDQPRSGWGAAYMASAFWGAGDPQRAVEAGQRALALAGTLGDASLQVVTHTLLGRVYYGLGDYPQAIDLLRQNLVTLEGALLQECFGLPAR